MEVSIWMNWNEAFHQSLVFVYVNMNRALTLVWLWGKAGVETTGAAVSLLEIKALSQSAIMNPLEQNHTFL